MMSTFRPPGHLQVKLDANGRTRAYWAFWHDQNDQKRGRRLGPAHVRDSGGTSSAYPSRPRRCLPSTPT